MQKSRKTLIEQFLDIDPAGDAADGAQRQAQILGEQFRLHGAARRMTQAMASASLKRLAMARPGQGRRFALCFQPFRHHRGER